MEEQSKYGVWSNDEITLKELILKIQEYIRAIFKSWWVVALFCTISVVGFVYKHYQFVPTYDAELRFMVEGQNGEGSGLSSLLGSFGINKSTKVDPYKILEVAKSMNILIKVLNQNVGPEQNIANSILRSYSLPEKWSLNNSNFQDFQFNNEININDSDLQREAIKKVRTIVWGNDQKEPITTLILDEETGIYSLTTKAISEELSLAITTNLYQEIKFFFEEEVFQNQKQLADILTMKADSIKALTESTIRKLAQFEDSNRSLISKQSMVTKNILMQESMALAAAYSEIIKNKEMSDIKLKDMQPLFMSIDTPFSPIAPSGSSILIVLIKGLLVGGFLSVTLILGIKIYKDAMSS